MSQPGWGGPPPQQGFGPPPGYGDPWAQQPPPGYGGNQQQYGGGWPQQPPQQPQRPPQRDTRSANDILMGGGGAPGWNFEGPGVRKVARITKPPVPKQEREYDKANPGAGKPKYFQSGDPIMGITVEVQTNERDPQDPDDDGKRTFYIEGKRLKTAVREAVQAAGGSGLEVGGTLDVTLTHYDEPNDRKSGRNWQIVYTLPGNNVLMDQPPQQPQQHQQQGGFQQAPPQQDRYPSQLGNGQAPQQPPEWAQQPPADPYQGGMSPEQQAAYDSWGGGGGQG